MASGNKIVVNPDPGGVKLEGTISGTPSPGTMMEISPAVAFVNGRPTYRVYQPGSDGQQRCCIILDTNRFAGPLATVAYVDGDHGYMYVPLAGEEMNILLADVAGTGDTHAIGDLMMPKSGTGKFVITSGSPEMNPFVLLEATAAYTADTLTHAMATGR